MQGPPATPRDPPGPKKNERRPTNNTKTKHPKFLVGGTRRLGLFNTVLQILNVTMAWIERILTREGRRM